jgi:6-phospho-beta-glucosidase
MRLAILGGGGFRTPHVWQALLRDTAPARVTEVVLQDVDDHRLAAMRAVLDSLGAGRDAPALRTTTDLRAALTGADFVFAAIRVGGLDGRCLDEHVALDLGVLGQETTGPGGLAYAIRTVPVMRRVA